MNHVMAPHRLLLRPSPVDGVFSLNSNAAFGV